MCAATTKREKEKGSLCGQLHNAIWVKTHRHLPASTREFPISPQIPMSATPHRLSTLLEGKPNQTKPKKKERTSPESRDPYTCAAVACIVCCNITCAQAIASVCICLRFQMKCVLVCVCVRVCTPRVIAGEPLHASRLAMCVCVCIRSLVCTIPFTFFCLLILLYLSLGVVTRTQVGPSSQSSSTPPLLPKSSSNDDAAKPNTLEYRMNGKVGGRIQRILPSRITYPPQFTLPIQLH